MEIILKINDVTGMTEDGRHIFQVNNEELVRCLMERKDWLCERVVKQLLLKGEKRLVADILADTDLANTIYMREKKRRDKIFMKHMSRSESFFQNVLNDYNGGSEA